MKVRYIKEGFGHEVGVVIDTTPKVAGILLRRGICEAFVGKVVANITDESAREKAETLEMLKNTEVGSIDYVVMKHIVSVLSIDTPDQKKVTLTEALTAYKATL